MEVGKEDEDGHGGTQNPNPNSIPNGNRTRGSSMGKSCKGCLYYSSLQKSKSKYPTCVGLSKTLHHVPDYIVGETELEASKEGRSFTDFKYACIGYSVFLDKKDSSSSHPQDKQAELPFCVGLEILLDKRSEAHTHAPAPAPTHVHNREEIVRPVPQPTRSYKPTHSAGEEYMNRFKRNAGLVAAGVARNVNRACHHIKDTLDDILYPYRRRPK
ncbi:hypothetical protein UlMin_032862 [Ulmus minor]